MRNVIDFIKQRPFWICKLPNKIGLTFMRVNYWNSNRKSFTTKPKSNRNVCNDLRSQSQQWIFSRTIFRSVANRSCINYHELHVITFIIFRHYYFFGIYRSICKQSRIIDKPHNAKMVPDLRVVWEALDYSFDIICIRYESKYLFLDIEIENFDIISDSDLYYFVYIWYFF